MRTILILIIAFSAISCNHSYQASDRLDAKEYEQKLQELSPYVIKKPDHITYEQRFDKVNAPFYQNFIKLTGSELRYYYPADTAIYFFFLHRDLTSLFEHYRGLGGYFREDDNGKIVFLNLLYHTPRFSKEEMAAKGQVLFEEMIQLGNVSQYVGNKNFIHTPNKDFYYNVKSNRWDYTPNSSWKFLQEEQRLGYDTLAANSDTVKK